MPRALASFARRSDHYAQSTVTSCSAQVATIKLDPQGLLRFVWFWRTDMSTILRVDVVEGASRQNYTQTTRVAP